MSRINRRLKLTAALPVDQITVIFHLNPPCFRAERLIGRPSLLSSNIIGQQL